MAQVGWIDFSADDRDKVKEVLALTAEKGTLDELGIGQVRDAFSDLLFPGISTIQTRAKYFITVPRIIRDYEKLKHSDSRYKKGLLNYLSVEENKLVKTFVDTHGDSEKGIVGSSTISDGGVKRLPSEIYWNGLRTFKLVNTKNSLAKFSQRLLNSDHAVDMEHDEDVEYFTGNKSLVTLPPDEVENWTYEDTLTIRLSRQEAEFLKGKMLENPDLSASIPVQLLKYGLVENALEESNNSDLVAFDVLSELMLKNDEVDGACKNILRLARDFSLAMEGPHIRLNVQLARNSGYLESAEEYEEEFSEWLERVSTDQVFTDNKVDDWFSVCAEHRDINTKTAAFIHEWCDAIRDGVDTNLLDEIVKARSKENKGKRGLLNRKINRDDWIGIRRLDFRWGAAKNIIADIHEGLDA